MSVPSREALVGLPVHVVVRDFPETLGVFRAGGVDVAERGGDPVAEAAGEDVEALLDALTAAVAWRADVADRQDGSRSQRGTGP